MSQTGLCSKGICNIPDSTNFLDMTDIATNKIIHLESAARCWSSPDFEDIVRQEIEQLDPSLLPLQQGLTTGSHVIEEPVRAIIFEVTQQQAGVIRVKAGLFYSSVIAGCSCADDPTPQDICQEYCVVQFDIDQQSAQTTVDLLTEQ